MQCTEIREMLSAYIDNMLNETDRAKVEGHLNTCGICRQELKDLEEAVKLIRSLGEVAPPENFRKDLISKLRKETVPSGKKLKSRLAGMGSWFSGTRRYAAAAVIIIGIGIGAGIYQLNQSNIISYGTRSEIAGNTDKYVSAKKKMPPVNNESGTETLQSYSISDAQITENSVRGIAKYDAAAQGAAQIRDAGEANKSMASAGVASKAASVQGLVETRETSKKAQKIIKEANLSLEVKNYRDFSSKLLTVTEQHGGYTENSSESLDSAVSASFVLRVPNEQFANLIAGIEKLGKVNSKQVSGRDVTGEFVDTESRLRNYQAQELRLLSLIDKAENLTEVVTLENELSRVRNEIELLQGRIKVLEDTVVYSTIRLEVIQLQKPQVAPPKGTMGKAIDNFKESCIAIINFGGEIVTFTGWLLPWILFIGLMSGSVVYYRSTKHKHVDK